VLHELLGEVGVIASRQLIHEIIDAFEDGVAESKKKSGGAKGYFGGSKQTESKSEEASSSSKSWGGEVCWDDGEEEGSSEGVCEVDGREDLECLGALNLETIN
ncbi:hypothetical protein Goari_002684, partial [Gossypium aridum]|nr:hypothetical protein [Gossypium aridum]